MSNRVLSQPLLGYNSDETTRQPSAFVPWYLLSYIGAFTHDRYIIRLHVTGALRLQVRSDVIYCSRNNVDLSTSSSLWTDLLSDGTLSTPRVCLARRQCMHSYWILSCQLCQMIVLRAMHLWKAIDTKGKFPERLIKGKSKS